jgi:hypothetical protein
MFERRISDEDVQSVLETGEAIENYLDNSPYPSRLILGFCGSRPIHILVADNNKDQETIVITVYEPDPAQWDPTFRRRKRS